MKKTIILTSICSLMLFSGIASAEELTCSDGSGSCTISEYEGSCECAGTGDGIAFAGSEAMEVSEESCLAMLAESCMGREVVDTCKSEKGECTTFSNGWADCICAAGWGSGDGQSEPGHPGEDSDSDHGGTDGSEGSGGTDVDAEGEDDAPVIEGDDEGYSDGDWDYADGDWIEPDGDWGYVDGDEDYVVMSCEEALAVECPDDPPDPSEHCETDALALCNKLAGWLADCFDETVWPFMIIDCCDEYGFNQDDMEDMWACLNGTACDAADDCFPAWEATDSEEERGEAAQDALFGGDKGGDGNGNDGPTDLDDSEDEDDGSGSGSDSSGLDCQHTGSPMGLLLMLVLLAVLTRRRLV